MISYLIQTGTAWLLVLSDKVPLPFFVFFGSLGEELLAPIPSALIMVTAGFLASLRGNIWLWLPLYAILGSLGKTGGSLVFYFLADKAEDLATSRWKKILGLSHQEIERVGKTLGERKFDTIFLFFTRVIPVFPTTIFSVACGLVKLDLWLYLKITLVGFFLRDLIMLVVGFLGVAGSHWLVASVDRSESVALIFFTILSLLFAFYLYWRQRPKKQ